VVLTCTAAVGSPSAWLPAQAENVLDAGGADLAVIFIGANDVTGSVDAEQAVAFLAEAVRALRRAGSEVVVATCPDLGSIPPIMPPLRWLVRRWSRQMARAQRRAVEAEGAYTVPLGELLGPVFDADPDTLFGPDRYHPSAAGYRAAVDVVLPTVLSVLDGALSRRSTGAADGDGAGGDGTGGDGTGGARGEDATKGAGADVAGRTPGGAVPCVSQSHSNA